MQNQKFLKFRPFFEHCLKISQNCIHVQIYFSKAASRRKIAKILNRRFAGDVEKKAGKNPPAADPPATLHAARCGISLNRPNRIFAWASGHLGFFKFKRLPPANRRFRILAIFPRDAALQIKSLKSKKARQKSQNLGTIFGN